MNPTDEQKLRYRELDNAVRLAAIQAAKEAAIEGAAEDYVQILMKPALFDIDRLNRMLEEMRGEVRAAHDNAQHLRTSLAQAEQARRELIQDQDRLLDALRLCAKGRGAAAVLARAEIKRIDDKTIPF